MPITSAVSSIKQARRSSPMPSWWSMRRNSIFGSRRPDQAPSSAEVEEIAANRRLVRFKDRISAVRKGSVLPRIEIVPEPGHTPGHSGYLIESAGERLFVWGDIVHQPRVQFACPDAGMVFHVDTEAAAAT